MSNKPRRLRKKSRLVLYPYQFLVTFDEDDRRLLDHAAKVEKLNRSDILRRALREYHRKLTDVAIAS